MTVRWDGITSTTPSARVRMRKTTKFLAAFWAILFLIPATEALAQRRRGLVDISPRSERHGLWFTIGAAAGADHYHYENGPGWNGVIGANGRREDQYAPTITLALGGTPNPRSEERRVGKECRSRWS